ncbi:hypothetical protein CN540_16850 [Bacillus toyonensis]|nr:hypothetical protein CN540_16850 [Bacillus toyonensis]PGE06648.1 hypothetical protein COM54_27655 [Bacillus toyonensis]PGE12884.1 hypothetical protein COM64_25830 [Bacillus toyonensis]
MVRETWNRSGRKSGERKSRANCPKIEETYPKWKKREITSVKFMGLLELKKNTFYKILKEYEENKLQPK